MPLVLTAKAKKKKLKRVKKLTVTIKWKVTGPKAGQSADGSPSATYKREEAEEDDLG